MIRHGVVFVLIAGMAAANWAAWLGWDQQADVHPDGSVSGPYEAWQVIGLVLVLGVIVVVAAVRQFPVEAILGSTAGTMVALSLDWSASDTSGMWGVGAVLILFGHLACTGIATYCVYRLLGRLSPVRG